MDLIEPAAEMGLEHVAGPSSTYVIEEAGICSLCWLIDKRRKRLRQIHGTFERKQIISRRPDSCAAGNKYQNIVQ